MYGVNEIMKRLYSMDNYWYLEFTRLTNIIFLLQVLFVRWILRLGLYGYSTAVSLSPSSFSMSKMQTVGMIFYHCSRLSGCSDSSCLYPEGNLAGVIASSSLFPNTPNAEAIPPNWNISVSIWLSLNPNVFPATSIIREFKSMEIDTPSSAT
jgi:hypothetical protein